MERNALALRFVTGYYDFSYRRGLKLQRPLDSLEMERLNLLQWMIFFNESHLL